MALFFTSKALSAKILALTNRINNLRHRPPEKKNTNIIKKCERQIRNYKQMLDNTEDTTMVSE